MIAHMALPRLPVQYALKARHPASLCKHDCDSAAACWAARRAAEQARAPPEAAPVTYKRPRPLHEGTVQAMALPSCPTTRAPHQVVFKALAAAWMLSIDELSVCSAPICSDTHMAYTGALPGPCISNACAPSDTHISKQKHACEMIPLVTGRCFSHRIQQYAATFATGSPCTFHAAPDAWPAHAACSP